MTYKATPTFIKDYIQQYFLQVEQETEDGTLHIDVPNAILTRQGWEALESSGVPQEPRNRAERRMKRRKYNA